MTIPITVFTGFLGAGKTSIILSLLSKLPKEYRPVLLKNEFGDVKGDTAITFSSSVDSQLAQESNIQVTEMMNGCLCCVLVGQMKNALLDIRGAPLARLTLADQQHPDRIIIETSGSAFPAPIAWQIRELESEGFVLDAIITVVDCVNFKGYEDTSYTAKLQAQYTDLILLNKHELVSERALDLVIDSVNDLNVDTPKVKFDAQQGLSSDMVFGLDTKLFSLANKERDHQTFQLEPRHQSKEIDIIQIMDTESVPNRVRTREELEAFLKTLPTEDIYRVKGLIRLGDNTSSSLFILNWAFGRSTLTLVTKWTDENLHTKLTVMGVDLSIHLYKFKQEFGDFSQVTLEDRH